MSQEQRRESVDIDGMSFDIPLLGVREQRRLLFKLAAVAGTSMAELVSDELAELKQGADEADKQKVLWEGLRTAFKSLASQDEAVLRVYEDTVNLFLGDGRTTGTKVRYRHETGEEAYAFLAHVHEKLFGQRLDLEFRWVWACLQVNYAPFLGSVVSGLGSALTELLAKVSQGSSSPGEQTG